ncbi:MAG: hypothetical protein QXH61_07390 [Candidatus Nezhaarchaeales archaeon]
MIMAWASSGVVGARYRPHEIALTSPIITPPNGIVREGSVI